MADVRAILDAELRTLEVARTHFPVWTDWGVEDQSVAVHSLGLSYLTTVGQRAGFACCCEYPVAGHSIRADSVWWDKQTRAPVALFEFERVKGGSELEDKVKNLLRAYHSLDAAPSLLCLVFWTTNFYPLGDQGVRGLWQILERGFTADDRTRVPPAPIRLLRVYECLHGTAGEGRHTLKRIMERNR